MCFAKVVQQHVNYLFIKNFPHNAAKIVDIEKESTVFYDFQANQGMEGLLCFFKKIKGF